MVSCLFLYIGNLHTWTNSLLWDSHRHLSVKYNVISTLTHRVRTVCSNPELLTKEIEHHGNTLTNCKYPKWALDKVEKRLTRSSSEVNDGANSQDTTGAQPVTNEVKTKGHIVVLYTQGLSESIKKICEGMVYKPISKVIAPSKTYCSSPRTKNPWSTEAGPYTGSNVVTLPAMMNA